MIIYLYKKTHLITGLQYFGKTTKPDYVNYRGSGKYWLRHIKRHGYLCKTELIRECHTTDEARYWGLYYSNLWNIVDSKEWANLIPENGLAGGHFPTGMSNPAHLPHVKEKLKVNNLITNASRRAKTSKALKGRKKSEEHKRKISESVSRNHKTRRETLLLNP